MTAPALLVIDAQVGIDDPRFGQRNNPQAEQCIARLLAAWRQQGKPIIHVQHMSTEADSPLQPGLPGNAFKPEATPRENEPVFRKKVNSAFIGTGLEHYLNDKDIRSLVVAGFITDHCVSTTVRMAANLGFDVILVDDATATFPRSGPDGRQYDADEMHRLAVASLHGEFATVRYCDDVLAAQAAA